MDSDVHTASYFRLEMHRPLIIAHILLMILAWMVLLPVVFAITNGAGALLGGVYSHLTPDLYENQKHSLVGWVGIMFSFFWLVITLVPKANADKRSHSKSFHSHEQTYEALLQSSQSSSFELEQEYQDDEQHGSILDDDGDSTDEKLKTGTRFCHHITTSAIALRAFAWMASKSPLKILRMLRTIFDRFIMVLGFVCIVTGVVSFTGSFRDENMFNGLAHSIKGGIFFWYGLLTFGRWLGCLADFGWAWNQKPNEDLVGSRSAKMPTMEFIESAAMCFYGVTNVWLEHLSNPGGTWEPRDFEHVSIAFLFFGGGLIGMILNSVSLLKLTMSHIRLLMERGINTGRAAVQETSHVKEQLQVCMNPIPAILVFLLGFLMSSHHQASKVASMLHMLWGQTFMAGALTRIATYAILFLRPPTSSTPLRPPTEVITSFCMIAGGLLLMLSNRDTIEALEYHDLDAMFVFTIVLGLTAILMAWVAICLAIKGWGQQRQH